MSFEEIRNRLNKATPGPWEVNSIGAKNYLLWFGGNWSSEFDDANYDFIAHARTDIQHLLDYIEYLENKNEILKIQLD